MTREKAIELAVRRHMSLPTKNLNRVGRQTYLELTAASIRLKRWSYEDAVKAIRTHFRIICRQYGVR